MSLRIRPAQLRSGRLAFQQLRPGLACHGRICGARQWMSSTSEEPPPLSLLKHRHLTGDGPGGFVKYDDAAAIQEDIRSKFLTWKSQTEDERTETYPQPQLLSFEATPTFTLGRRQDALTDEQTSHLRSQLNVSFPDRREPISESFIPEVRKTNRGGLTTYHGPGQIVFWPVLDMHSPLYERFSVISYATQLEYTTQRFLASLFNIKTYTTRDEPGVWVTDPGNGPARKIAAMGVHHRRHVTALGVAVNIDVPISGGEDINPWARFVPCGLEGKLVTSVVAEGGNMGEWDVPTLAGRWASLFEEGLKDSSRKGPGGEVENSRKGPGLADGIAIGLFDAINII